MAQSPLITLIDPRSPATEAYRTLRTNLEFSSLDHPLCSLLVTSPSANTEKSVTLANLAVVMAEGRRRVILVDADLRRPALHEIFGVDNDVGLSDLVDQESDLHELPLQKTQVDGLYLLTSGPLPQNPSILMGSARMGQVIDALVTNAEIVLFDAPPVIAVTDAALLAAKVDGTLLVIRAGSTQREHVLRAKALLDKVNAHLVGATLTHASLGGSESSYYR
jgi:capsular exopolysaccharide synthesis family protein